jgi:hypothetical protein
MTNSQTSNNELDNLFDDDKTLTSKSVDGRTVITFHKDYLRQQLSNLIKEIIGQPDPRLNPGGNQNKRTVGNRNTLRTEQRQRATNLGFNIGDKNE